MKIISLIFSLLYFTLTVRGEVDMNNDQSQMTLDITWIKNGQCFISYVPVRYLKVFTVYTYSNENTGNIVVTGSIDNAALLIRSEIQNAITRSFLENEFIYFIVNTQSDDYNRVINDTYINRYKEYLNDIESPEKYRGDLKTFKLLEKLGTPIIKINKNKWSVIFNVITETLSVERWELNGDCNPFFISKFERQMIKLDYNIKPLMELR